MKVEINPGKYIVAVSGGVDSVVLLELLLKNKNLDLVVAHFDHGIRKESASDKQFVETLAKKYQLPFESERAELGSKASEETARKARYIFLEKVRKKYKAEAIVTAHHQDDIIETIILNIARGTGRKGGSSLQDRNGIVRPLVKFRKQQLINYAKKNKLDWVEDASNSSNDYTRNKIRNYIIPKMNKSQIEQIIKLYEKHRPLNQEVDKILSKLTGSNSNKIDRLTLIGLDYKISCETVAHWLRANNLREFDKNTIDRLVIGVKTLRPGNKIEIYAKNYAVIYPDKVSIEKLSEIKGKTVNPKV